MRAIIFLYSSFQWFLLTMFESCLRGNFRLWIVSIFRNDMPVVSRDKDSKKRFTFITIHKGISCHAADCMGQWGKLCPWQWMRNVNGKKTQLKSFLLLLLWTQFHSKPDNWFIRHICLADSSRCHQSRSEMNRMQVLRSLQNTSLDQIPFLMREIYNAVSYT